MEPELDNAVECGEECDAPYSLTAHPNQPVLPSSGPIMLIFFITSVSQYFITILSLYGGWS